MLGQFPTGRTINGKPLSANVALSATDVGSGLQQNTIGVANGVVSLNSDGKLLSMPTFDDFFVSGEWTPRINRYTLGILMVLISHMDIIINLENWYM